MRRKDIFILLFLFMGVFAFLNGIRFVFLMSIPFCLLSGIALDETVKKEKKYFLIVLVLCVIFIALGYQFSKMEFYRPSKYWLDAMDWLRTETPENSTILVWWNYGGFVQGLGERGSWIDGTEGQHFWRIRRLAENYLADADDDSTLEFFTSTSDYLVFSMEEVLVQGKWFAIIKRANESFKHRAFNILNHVSGSVYKRDTFTIEVFTDGNEFYSMFDDGKVKVFARKTLQEIRDGDTVSYKMSEIKGDTFETQFGSFQVLDFGVMLIPKMAIIVSPELFNTFFIRMNVLVEPPDGFSLVYSNGLIKIYKVEK